MYLINSCENSGWALKNIIDIYCILPYKALLFFLIINPTRCSNFSNLFWNKTLHVSDSSSVHHQQFFTVHTVMVYVIQLASRIRTKQNWSCSQAVSKPVWHIPLLCVQWKTPDGGQRNCPKHAEYYSKNKFEKLMQLHNTKTPTQYKNTHTLPKHPHIIKNPHITKTPTHYQSNHTLPKQSHITKTPTH